MFSRLTKIILLLSAVTGLGSGCTTTGAQTAPLDSSLVFDSLDDIQRKITELDYRAGDLQTQRGKVAESSAPDRDEKLKTYDSELMQSEARRRQLMSRKLELLTISPSAN